MKSSLLYISLLVGTAIIFYLSWLPNPRISTYSFFPKELGLWVDADANINIRTAVPFLGLGLMVGFWLGITKRGWQGWIGFALGFLVTVFLAEAGQLEIPSRHFDWGDIGWGTAGALVGMALGAVFAYMVSLFRPTSPTL